MTAERHLYLALEAFLTTKSCESVAEGEPRVFDLDDSASSNVVIPLKGGDVLSLPVVILRDAP